MDKNEIINNLTLAVIDNMNLPESVSNYSSYEEYENHVVTTVIDTYLKIHNTVVYGQKPE